MCLNVPMTKPRGVTFQVNATLGQHTPPDASSNTLPDVINVDETSEPDLGDLQRLMVELRRINDAVKASAATQSQNENATRTHILEPNNLGTNNNSPIYNTERGRTRHQRSRSVIAQSPEVEAGVETGHKQINAEHPQRKNLHGVCADSGP